MIPSAKFDIVNLIIQRQEAAVYEVLRGKGICDDVVLIDPQKGWKVTAFLENARVCDPESPEDLKNAPLEDSAFSA